MSADRITTLLDKEPEAGCLEISELNELVEALELGDEEVEHLYEQLEERTSTCATTVEGEGREHVRQRRPRPARPTRSSSSSTRWRYPLLTADEEVELAKRIERGDKEAKDRMINSNLRLVVSIAKKYQARALAARPDPGRDHQVHPGSQRSSTGARKFKFSTYATCGLGRRCSVDVASKARIDPNAGAHRRPRAEAREPSASSTPSWGREPTLEEIANASKLPLKQVKEVQEAARAVTSLDRPVGAEGDTSLGELTAGDEAPPEEEVEVSLRQDALRRASRNCPTR